MVCEVVYVHGTGELMAWHAEGARVRVRGWASREARRASADAHYDVKLLQL